MGKDTATSWADHTFNPWRIKGDTRVVASEVAWKEPLKWDREAKAAGVHRRVFCASMADVFEDWTGQLLWSDGTPAVDRFSEEPYTLNHARRDLFQLIDRTPNLDWLLLTKRPENLAAMMPQAGFPTAGVPGRLGRYLVPPNVWLGTTVENQQAADERIPHLLRVPAVVRFLSCEPLLGPINLVPHRNADGEVVISQGIDVDWVIAGGESGPHARPSHPDWFRSLRDQCQAAGVPFHFKQWGSWEPVTPLYDGRDDTLEDGTEIIMQRDGLWNERDGQPTDSRAWLMRRVGKSSAGRMLDGRTWDEVPSLTFAPDA